MNECLKYYYCKGFKTLITARILKYDFLSQLSGDKC